MEKMTLSCEQHPDACFECLTVTATDDDGNAFVLLQGESKAAVFGWLSDMVRRDAPDDVGGFKIIDARTSVRTCWRGLSMADALHIFAKYDDIRHHGCIEVED